MTPGPGTSPDPAARPAAGSGSAVPGRIVVPLALCQFIASYAASNMNVAISAIAHDLHTDVSGIQTSITLFTLVMAALMIPGSKLTDLWGRKRCFLLGLVVYGAGALIAALSTGLPLLVVGYSVFEGVGSALMIPPIYIIVTVAFTDTPSRARAFGLVSAAGGVGAAAGPLIGGLVTTAISWRASFILQVLVVAAIGLMASRTTVPEPAERQHDFDVVGSVLSAAGLVLLVVGFLQSRTYGWFASRQSFAVFGTVVIQKGGVSPVWLFVGAGALVLVAFVLYLRRRARAHKPVLVAPALFRNKTSNRGLVAQNLQWLILQGSFFVLSVFLQEVRDLNAVQTGLVLTPATIGILSTATTAGRLARWFSQKTLTWGGFVVTLLGLGLLLAFARATSSIWTFVPGILVMGMGIGAMLTSAVNVVQSAFGDAEQGEISGISRSASNLGSSLGTAIVGSVLVSTAFSGNEHFLAAVVVMMGFAVLGLLVSAWLPAGAGRPVAEPVG
ncbi:MAG TPA: MFS transporter [Acidimicrobiales bacterium]|nr:MFS transporter [Acidimicrobiales bacterium]